MTSETHAFSVQLAIDLGSVDLALVLNHFLHWIGLNKRKGINFIDGRTWTFDTQENITLHFPYYKPHQVKYFIKVLVQKGILIKANHNKIAFDKTTWYAFADESKWSFSNKSYDRENSPTEERNLSNGKEKIVKAIPKSIPKSKPSFLKDLGNETLASDKNKKKTLDAPRRWGLTEQQTEAFEVLKTFDIDADDKKLCFWVKTHSLDRLLAVYHEAKAYKPRSMKLYMAKLLDENKAVPSANAEQNRQFAIDLMKSNNWYGPKIYKKYMKIPFGNDYFEISFDESPDQFVYRLLDKYETWKSHNL